MINPKHINSAITLELSGEITTSDDFRRVVETFDDLLKAVTRSVFHGKEAMKWAVRLKEGSNVMEFNPVGLSKVDTASIQAVFSQMFEKHVVPENCPESANHIHELARTKDVHVWVGKERTSITDELSSRLKAPLQESYKLTGSISGRLTILDEKGTLAIQEPILQKRIKCSVREKHLEDMRHLWRKRVTAEGIVHYGHDGYPTQIDAERVHLIPDDDKLPSHMDVLGILKAD